MPVAFESQSNTTYAARTTTTVTAPSGIANGDLLLAFFFILSANADPPAGTVTPPSGFDPIPDLTWPLHINNVSGNDAHAYGYYKIASGESGDYSWTHNNLSTQGVVARISGADTTNPFDVASTQNQGTGTTTTWTGVTTATDGALIYIIEWDWADNSNNTVVPTGSTPTFTEQLDVVLTFVATGTMTTAGPTGDKTHTNNAGAFNWAAVLVAAAPTSLGPTQTILPDADIVTTGWTSTPLFSKVNDASDASVITATLA